MVNNSPKKAKKKLNYKLQKPVKTDL